ncbi:MAG: 4,5-dihydroxyphthalate decarboxylase [Candidatus Dormibacteraeota bacterium]|nr:4,5-dihydroxyphthalate decarboxylase [Candidatus Dormibacteraeota bacterium]
MDRLRLTAAVGDYDHVRDLWSGRVEAEGIELVHLDLPIEEIFHRFTRSREWEVSEMSMGRFVALRSRGDQSMVAIPVFPSRVFRHSSVYVRADSDLDQLHQLKGLKVGVPEWAQTATIYLRGVLTDQCGISLGDIEWFQAGLNQVGRAEPVEVNLPPGVRVSRVSDRTLDEMLASGFLDAIVSARRPPGLGPGGAHRRLLRDAQKVEQAYWSQTGIFPIMHVIVVRRDVYDAHPWVAMNLFDAFDRARRRSLDRLRESTASRFPVPWAADQLEHLTPLFGGDYWPYGLEPNRTTLTAFLRYAFEQGVCACQLAPEELFPAAMLDPYRV